MLGFSTWTGIEAESLAEPASGLAQEVANISVGPGSTFHSARFAPTEDQKDALTAGQDRP